MAIEVGTAGRPGSGECVAELVGVHHRYGEVVPPVTTHYLEEADALADRASCGAGRREPAGLASNVPEPGGRNAP